MKVKDWEGKNVILRLADQPEVPERLCLMQSVRSGGFYTLFDLGELELVKSRLTAKDLQDWMERNQFTQQMLGDATGYSRVTVSCWLKGTRKIPRKLHNVLRIPLQTKLDTGDKIEAYQGVIQHSKRIIEEMEKLIREERD
jgi:hypothetical protein